MRLIMLGWPSDEALDVVRQNGHHVEPSTSGPANTRIRVTNDVAAIVGIAQGARDAEAVLVPDGPASTGDPDSVLILLAADRLGVPVLGWPSMRSVELPRIQKTALDIAREEAELALLIAVRQAAESARDLVPLIDEHHNLQVIPSNIAAVVGAQLTSVLQQLQTLQPAKPTIIGTPPPDSGQGAVLFTVV